MDRDRLERTADHLDKISSREDVAFDMQTFLSKTPDCGTSACAIGFLINDKVFPDLIAIPDTARTGVVGETNDLPYEDLDYLFEAETYSEDDPDWGPECIRPKDVALRIRGLLNRSN